MLMTSQYPELYADNDWSFMGTINEKKDKPFACAVSQVQCSHYLVLAQPLQPARC